MKAMPASCRGRRDVESDIAARLLEEPVTDGLNVIATSFAVSNAIRRCRGTYAASRLIFRVAGACKPIFLEADMVSAIKEDRDVQEVCGAVGAAGTRPVGESGLEG